MERVKRFRWIAAAFLVFLGGLNVWADPMSTEMADDLMINSGAQNEDVEPDDDTAGAARSPSALTPTPTPENDKAVILSIVGVQGFQQFSKFEKALKKHLPVRVSVFRKRVVRGEVDLALQGMPAGEELKKVLETLEIESGRIEANQVDDHLIKIRIQ